MLDGVGGQCHAPAALPPGQTRYLLCRRLDGPQGRSGRVRKISPPLGFTSHAGSTCSCTGVVNFFNYFHIHLLFLRRPDLLTDDVSIVRFTGHFIA